MIPNAADRPLLSVDELLEAVPGWPLGRSSTYEALRRGELPVVKVGTRRFIPTAALRQLLCLDEAAAGPQTRNEASVSTTEASLNLLATPDPEVRRRDGGYTRPSG